VKFSLFFPARPGFLVRVAGIRPDKVLCRRGALVARGLWPWDNLLPGVTASYPVACARADPLFSARILEFGLDAQKNPALCVLGCRDLLRDDCRGISIQTYPAIIACMLTSLTTGRKPTLRTYEMICYYVTGMADEEELLAHLAKLKSHDAWSSGATSRHGGRVETRPGKSGSKPIVGGGKGRA
jgi:hypothetical protein